MIRSLVSKPFSHAAQVSREAARSPGKILTRKRCLIRHDVATERNTVLTVAVSTAFFSQSRLCFVQFHFLAPRNELEIDINYLLYTMEALSALGLAGNVVQFVDFVSQLISTGSEIAGSVQGTTERTLEFEKVYDSLNSFSSRLHVTGNHASNNKDTEGLRGLLADLTEPSQRVELQSHIRSLEELAADCSVLCQQLLEMVRKFRVKGSCGRSFKSFLAALKMAWSSKKIQGLEERLNRYRRMISLHFFPLLRYVAHSRFI